VVSLKAFVVIPALNEEKTIGRVVHQVRKAADRVIVIDDCSSDTTAATASRAGAVVFSNKKNLGYSRTVSKAVEKAVSLGAEVVITMDADAQHSVSDIPLFLKKLRKEKCALVVGKRPYAGRIFEKLFSLYFRKFGIDDPLCGMKAYTASCFKEIGFLDRIGTIGTQFLVTASKRGFSVCNLPVRLLKRSDKPRFGGRIFANLKTFSSLIRIIIFDFFGY
jgi:glycosyltransferase involved in cell wall biosynthesis